MDIYTNSRDHIRSVVLESQRCQRNWDLSQPIPQEDIDLIVHAATECPSKQNADFYNLHVIRNREIIEEIYEYTDVESGLRKNPQVLANVLFAFTEKRPTVYRSDRYRRIAFGSGDNQDKLALKLDTSMAIGVAAGYISIVSHMLGYKTGFCKCVDTEHARFALRLYDPILLMIGVGYPQSGVDRRINHDTGEMTETFDKPSSIKVTYHD